MIAFPAHLLYLQPEIECLSKTRIIPVVNGTRIPVFETAFFPPVFSTYKLISWITFDSGLSIGLQHCHKSSIAMTDATMHRFNFHACFIMVFTVMKIWISSPSIWIQSRYFEERVTVRIVNYCTRIIFSPQPQSGQNFSSFIKTSLPWAYCTIFLCTVPKN